MEYLIDKFVDNKIDLKDYIKKNEERVPRS